MSESKLTFLDRAIATVSPSLAVRRAVARYHLREFSEGSWERGSSGGRSRHASSESQRNNRKRIDRIWEARDMEERFCFVRGTNNRLEQYVCGHINYQAQTGTPEVDREYQDFFHDWCTRADITGRFRLRELAGMGFRGMVRDGQHGFIQVQEGEELRLQAVEGDRIGDPGKITNDERNIGGIKIGDRGEIVGYEITKRSRQGQYTPDVTVEPENFIHLYKATRSDQYHGESWWSAALPHARDIHEVIAFEKQAMKFASMFAGFIKSKDPFAPATGTSWATRKSGPGGANTMEAQAGRIQKLMEGEEIIFPTSTGRPSGNLIQFIDILYRECAHCLDMPFGFLYNMGDLGGVNSRIELMLAWRGIRRMQQLMEEKFLQRVKDRVLDLGIAFGKITPHPNWNKGKFSFGSQITGDSGNFIQEQILMLQNGLTTRSNIIEMMLGMSNADVVDKLASEILEYQTAAAEKKIPVELINASLPNATQLLAAINTPPAVPEQPKGLVGKIGSKEVEPLMDLLEKYGTGKIDRPSAINSIVMLYGTTRAKAEAMVPKKQPEAAKAIGASRKGAKPAKDDKQGKDE